MAELVKVDTRAFDSAFKDYLKFNQRAIPEIVNTKLYFIARNAVNKTKAQTKAGINAALIRGSKVNPEAPIVAILVNIRRRAKGQKGLTGAKMQRAINKLIKARQNTVNFLRAGWLPAIKLLDRVVKKKTGAPTYDKKIKIKGAPKGGAKAAPALTWNATGVIWNEVHGSSKWNRKSTGERIATLIKEGAQAALEQEMASMRSYVEKKLSEGIKDFNRK